MLAVYNCLHATPSMRWADPFGDGVSEFGPAFGAAAGQKLVDPSSTERSPVPWSEGGIDSASSRMNYCPGWTGWSRGAAASSRRCWSPSSRCCALARLGEDQTHLSLSLKGGGRAFSQYDSERWRRGRPYCRCPARG